MKNALHACVIVLAALGALVACSETLTTPTAGNLTSQARPSGALSLRTSEWDTISDPATFPLNNDASGHLVFDFPVTSGSINYLYNVNPPAVIAGTVSVSVQVTTSGPVVFNYMTEPFNTCQNPASVRPFIWSNRNSEGEFDRWWSNPTTYPLAAGSATLDVALIPDRWSSVYGRFGNADAAAQAGFNTAIRNVSRLGLTFGGGCFFGHGINVHGGNAQFVLVTYQIQ